MIIVVIVISACFRKNGKIVCLFLLIHLLCLQLSFPCSTAVLLTFVTNVLFVVIICSDPTDDDRSIMTEQLETVPKEEKAERELRRSSLDKHKKEKPFKTGRGRISTPERKIAKKEPSTLSRDEVRRKKGSFNTPYYNIYIFNFFKYIFFFTIVQYYPVTLL